MASPGPRLPSKTLADISADDSNMGLRADGSSSTGDARRSWWTRREVGSGSADQLDAPLLRRHSDPGGAADLIIHKCMECRALPEEGDGELRRRLGPVELTLLGVGACIGAGIFVLSGVEARAAGPSVSAAFFFAALSSVANGLCYAELSSRLPISGSAYLYAYCMFGELPAMIVVVNQLLDYHIGAATMARSLTAYMGEAAASAGYSLHPCITGCEPLGAAAPWLSISLGAPVALFLAAGVVAGGAKMSASITSIMTTMKLGIILLVVAAGSRMVDVRRWQPFFPYGIGATLQAAATLNYAFVGYDVIANAAEETRNPQRDIPIAIVSALTICAVLYLVACMVLCGMQSYADIDAAAPMASAFVQNDMMWVAGVINIGAFFGIATGLLAGVYGQSRIYFALARDRLAPASLKDPSRSSLWCGLVAATLAVVFDVHQLASLLNIGVLLAYAVTAASVLKINSLPRCERRPFFRSENFAILLVVCLTIMMSHGGLVASAIPGLAAVALVGVVSTVALVREYCTKSGGAFKCPGLPVTPMVALITDVYLATQLSSNAWLRLLITAALVTVVLGAVEFRDMERRQDDICQTVRAAAKAAGTKPGLCNKC